MAESLIDHSQEEKEEKRKQYENLWGGGVPDAFSLLANGIKAVGTRGREKTGSYADMGARGDINGSHGGMLAINTLKKDYFPDALVVTNSYNVAIDRWPEERHAEIAAKELTASGIPEDDIIVQEESVSTVSELLQNIVLTENHQWKNVVMVTNGAQLLRARAMLEKIDTIFDPLKFRERPEIQAALATFLERQKKGEVKMSVISAEDMLELKDPRLAKLVQAVRESALYQESKKRQDNAAEQIKAGTYGKNPPPVTLVK